MKDTFEKIAPEKRGRIIASSIEEFAEWGYEKGSTDRIIARSGISKGGLYEYINSKEELFLYVVDHTYSLLYDYIMDRIRSGTQKMPGGLLERFMLVAGVAIDFYLQNPVLIRLIVKTNHVIDQDVALKVRAIFMRRFREIFGDAGTTPLAFKKEKVLELMEWLLLKTRNDFMENFMAGKNPRTVRKEYIEEWEFIISVMKQGVYKTKER